MSPPDLTRWPTPAGSALQRFEIYWSALTDAPREYIIPSGLSTIGTVIANRVYVPFGGDRIYGNSWNVLFGPSSTYRKSTVVKFARRTLADLSAGQPDAYVFPDEFSKEAFVSVLSEKPQGLLTYREFSGALAGFSRDYMSGMKELLADLYDCPEHYERVVGKQKLTATNVCLSILAASQTDWLLDKLHENDMRGGFLARFTFWPAFYKRRFLAIPPEPNIQARGELLRHLNTMRKLEGPLVLPTSVRDQYHTWLQEHERQLEALPRAGQLGPFWSRMGITTLKLALVLHVAHGGHALDGRRGADVRDRPHGLPEGRPREALRGRDRLHPRHERSPEGTAPYYAIVPASASAICSGPRVSRRSNSSPPSRRCSVRTPSAERKTDASICPHCQCLSVRPLLTRFLQ